MSAPFAHILAQLEQEPQHGEILDIWARVWDAQTGSAIMVPVSLKILRAGRVDLDLP